MSDDKTEYVNLLRQLIGYYENDLAVTDTQFYIHLLHAIHEGIETVFVLILFFVSKTRTFTYDPLQTTIL